MTASEETDRKAAGVEPLDAAACLFHGFSDPSRIAILRHLALGEHRVTDLTAHIGLAQSTVSKHLACLRDCGLVASRPEGRASMFTLTHPEGGRPMAKHYDPKVTIMIVGGILALLGVWFSLPALAPEKDPIGDCVEQALHAEGTRVAVSPQEYEDLKGNCEKGPGR